MASTLNIPVMSPDRFLLMAKNPVGVAQGMAISTLSNTFAKTGVHLPISTQGLISAIGKLSKNIGSSISSSPSASDFASVGGEEYLGEDFDNFDSTASFVQNTFDDSTPTGDDLLAEGVCKITDGAETSDMFNTLTEKFDDLSQNFSTEDVTNKIKSVLPLGASSLPKGLGQTITSASPVGKSGGNGKAGFDDFVVKLYSKITNETLTFDAMPSISESGEAQYSEINPAQMPGSILKYEKSPSRSWSISNIKLISMTSEEASKNQKILNMIRAWRMPFFGTGTELEYPSQFGAPPVVLVFSAYGMKNIGPIPVVLTSYSWDWSNDVDYIPTLEGDPFPVIMNISLGIRESYSPAEIQAFGLLDYRQGNVAAAFTIAAPQQKENSTNEGLSTPQESSASVDAPSQLVEISEPSFDLNKAISDANSAMTEKTNLVSSAVTDLQARANDMGGSLTNEGFSKIIEGD
jgi:hypothetical protein